MTIYTVTYRSATRWAEQTIRARTPQAALAKAHKAFALDPISLDWETYDSGIEALEEIEVNGPTDGDTAFWQSDEIRCQCAARDVLEALEVALGRLEISNCAGEEDDAVAQAKAAIAVAKGGAA